MNKRQLIEEIRQFNTTAQPSFLLQFDEEALQQYLQTLQEVARKRAMMADWTRRPSTTRIAS